MESDDIGMKSLRSNWLWEIQLSQIVKYAICATM